MRGLDIEGPEIATAALGDAPEDRLAAGAVLPGNQAEPRAEVATTGEGLSLSDSYNFV